MLAAVVGLVALAGATDHPQRRIRWYVNTANHIADTAFILAHRSIVSSVILTADRDASNTSRFAGLLSVTAGGNISHCSSSSAEDCLTQAAEPYQKVGVDVYVGITVAQDAVLGGTCTHDNVIKTLIGAAQAANITGIMVDYEPRTSITSGHQKLYQAFLTALGQAADAEGIELGMAVAVSGILQPGPGYGDLSGLSWVSSMDPTLFSTSALSSIGFSFLQSMIRNFGHSRTSAGIGSVVDSPLKCSPDYEWGRETLHKFLEELCAQNITHLDIMPCDLSCKTTFVASFFVDELKDWVDDHDVNQ
eukprot:Hpha_TRINITY_DN14681_c0_g2::TRINITY_DN14681_c0_g2_i1::g.47782::m.47782